MKRTPFVHLAILIAFLLNTIVSVPVVQAQELVLPKPGVMVRLSPPENLPTLKGIKIHPDNPFRFEFILHKGDFAGNDQDPLLQDESAKLIKYFLASLTIPEKDMWVNLSPYEKDRIVPESFGVTEMGRDLLAQDYMLKQITASLIYPEGEVGKKFWKKVYEQAAAKYGSTNIPVNTFNKVWIVPEKAVVYENAKAGTAYVIESKLKVMLEQDYLSLEKNTKSLTPQKETNQIGSQIVREIVIPELTKEVNEGKNFAQLRQVYNSLLLATWYKKKIKDSVLAKVYADQSKTQGVNIQDPQEKQKIYQQYLQAFKKGVYNYIKEDLDPVSHERIPRKYFSGGVDMAMNSQQRTSLGLEADALKYTDSLPKGLAAQGDYRLDAAIQILGTSDLDKGMLSDQNEDKDSAMFSKEFFKAFFGKKLTKDEMRKVIAGNIKKSDFRKMMWAFRVMLLAVIAVTAVSISAVSNSRKQARRDYSVEELVRMSKSRKVEERRVAGEELSRHAKNKEAVEALKILLQDPDVKVRVEAARSLVIIYNADELLQDEIENALFTVVHDPEPDVRMNAMQGLKKVNQRNINSWLIGLDDQSPEMVMVCVSNIRSAMGKRLSPDQEELLSVTLRPQVNNPNAAVRLLAIERLQTGDIFKDFDKTKKDFRDLIIAAKDTDDNVAQAATTVLQEFSAQFIDLFNERHNYTDLNARFEEARGLNAVMLYHIMYYSKEASYTSTFKGLFNLFLRKLEKEKLSGYDLLQEYARHENPRRFLALLTQYRPALSTFLSTIDPQYHKVLMDGFIQGLDQVNPDDLYAEGALLAEAIHTFKDDSQMLLDFKKLLLSEAERVTDKNVKKVYTVLSGMIPDNGVFGSDWVSDMEKKFNLRNLDNVPVSKLVDSEGRVVIRHIFAYTEKDSLADSRVNYKSFKDLYGKNPNWTFQENLGKNYVIVRSKGDGPQVVMFANIPFYRNGYNEDFDAGNRAVEEAMKKNNNARAVGVFARGHQYAVKDVIKFPGMIKGNESFIILGNCGGAGLFNSTLKMAPGAALSGTYSTGYRDFNNNIMGSIIDMLKVADGKVDFPLVKKQLEDAYGGEEVMKEYEYVFLPSDPQLVFLTVVFREDKAMATETQALQNDKAQFAEQPTKKYGGIDFNADKINLQIKQADEAGIKFDIDPAMLKQLQGAAGFTPVIIQLKPLENLQMFLGASHK